jgi:hypothetical protein
MSADAAAAEKKRVAAKKKRDRQKAKAKEKKREAAALPWSNVVVGGKRLAEMVPPVFPSLHPPETGLTKGFRAGCLTISSEPPPAAARLPSKGRRKTGGRAIATGEVKVHADKTLVLGHTEDWDCLRDVNANVQKQYAAGSGVDSLERSELVSHNMGWLLHGQPGWSQAPKLIRTFQPIAIALFLTETTWISNAQAQTLYKLRLCEATDKAKETFKINCGITQVRRELYIEHMRNAGICDECFM